MKIGVNLRVREERVRIENELDRERESVSESERMKTARNFLKGDQGRVQRMLL